MANKNNVSYAQKHIKAFNKYLSRHLDQVSDLQYEVVTDLIGNLTASGYGKAGTKFLERLTDEQLQSYLADIDAARDLMQQEETVAELAKEFLYMNNPRAALWGLFNRLEEMGHPYYDSEQIKEIVDGDIKVDFNSAIVNLAKTIEDDYGVADFSEWFDRQPRLK